VGPRALKRSSRPRDASAADARAEAWIEKFIEAYEGPEIPLNFEPGGYAVTISPHRVGAGSDFSVSFSLDMPPTKAAELLGRDLDDYSLDAPLPSSRTET
jgi:hypothetical protein